MEENSAGFREPSSDFSFKTLILEEAMVNKPWKKEKVVAGYMISGWAFVHKRGVGTVVHTCNPNTLEGQAGQITSAQEFETSLGNMVKPRLY